MTGAAAKVDFPGAGWLAAHHYLGWVLLTIGTVLWTYGYFAAGTPSFVAWADLLPAWAADTLPNLEAELGTIIVTLACIPFYWDMLRSR